MQYFVGLMSILVSATCFIYDMREPPLICKILVFIWILSLIKYLRDYTNDS